MNETATVEEIQETTEQPRRIQVMTHEGLVAFAKAMNAEMRERRVSVYPKAVRTDWGQALKATFYAPEHEGLHWTWETVGGEVA